MKSRITLSIRSDGSFEMFLNEAGRDDLVELLQSLSKENDHFHLAPKELELDCEISEIPYRESDQLLSNGKVLFRPDDWDRLYFPHVMNDEPC
ncbi:hypothetical protein [Pseudovibrio brasiliensis]|nr:hypothetical protein [Pseudovibrio brasiliensis]